MKHSLARFSGGPVMSILQPNRFVLILLASLVPTSVFATDAPVRPGFIAASQAIITDAPSLNGRRVVTWRIGTPVQWRHESGAWCSVLLPGSTASRGFLSCALITQQRPTLESEDAALAASGLSPTLENELLARRFYLSPSLETLRLVRARKGLAHSDLPGPEGASKPSAALAADEAFFAALMDAFRDEVTGEDFRPIDLRINEGRKLPSAAASSLPPVKPSLFRTAYDVFVAGEAMTAGPSVDAMAVTASTDDWTSGDIIEFSKLYPGQRLYVRHLPPVYPRDEPGAIAWHDAGGVDVSFARPLRGVVLSGDRAIPARVTTAKEFFASEDGCSAMPAVVRAELSQPMSTASGLLLALAPTVEVKSVKRIGNATNPAVFDLDDDGVADVATLTFPSKDTGSSDGQTTAVMVNVDGAWRLAFEQTDIECD